ncbi:hypothetical protein J9874_02520 [Duffyella gerundensis]|nr:hypothetical protein J9874_02520 [Duffyella gerundensis]
MIYVYFVVPVILLIVTVILLQRFTTLEFVSHAKLLFRTWSVWLGSLGSALSAWAQSFPDAAMNGWQALPEDIKSYLPQNYLGFVGAFMVAMAVIAQFVRQKNLVQRKDDLQTQSNTSTTVSTTNSNSSSNVTTSNGNGQ